MTAQILQKRESTLEPCAILDENAKSVGIAEIGNLVTDRELGLG